MTKNITEEEVTAQTTNIQRRIMGEEGGKHKGDKPARDAEPGEQDMRDELLCVVYHTVYNLQDDMDRKMYTDQTGKFSVCSYRGIQYVMILLKIQST